jgi:HSP20 family molecular chaperone IbpA
LFDLLNNPQLAEDEGGHPPYDIVRTGPDTYRIAVAIAGFTPDEITVTSQQNLLTVEGRKAGRSSSTDMCLLHHADKTKDVTGMNAVTVPSATRVQ